MRKAVVSLLLMLPLAGCFPGSDPIAPELKGRWAAPNAARLRTALLMNGPLVATPASVTEPASCRDQYVTFDRKYGVALYMNGRVNPLFMVTEVKRDGARFNLVGMAPVHGAVSSRIEITARKDAIRFDDIVDERGRSIKFDRIDNEQARRAGITTVGDIFRLVLDLKPCNA